MSIRTIDFYIKGLPLDVRLEIFNRLDKVGVGKIEKLLEKNTGYRLFRMMGLNDEGIARQENMSRERFKAVNDYVIANERYPFFTDPNDTYQSAVEYVDLLKKRTIEEAEQIMGCSWEEYVPRKYVPKDFPSNEDVEI